jgi:hypothetical protein
MQDKINKQETLEEAFKNTYLGDKISFNSDIGKAFELGYNLTKEQDNNKFSEEQMKQFAFECVGNFLSNNNNMVERELIDVIIDRNNNQFEQFKKK